MQEYSIESALAPNTENTRRWLEADEFIGMIASQTFELS
jgi:hypothetical protein